MGCSVFVEIVQALNSKPEGIMLNWAESPFIKLIISYIKESSASVEKVEYVN